jgi:hypothetical protein
MGLLPGLYATLEFHQQIFILAKDLNKNYTFYFKMSKTSQILKLGKNTLLW